MRDSRSASQILFGFLPEQTVDLQGRVWKVRDWQTPIRRPVDEATLRRELCRLTLPWEATGLDGGFGRDLRSGREIKVYSLNRDNGVRVEPFPEVWMCQQCKRVADSPTRPCACGNTRFGQLPFVGYHDACGSIRAPWIPRCPTHDEVRVELPGTSSAAEIVFRCPICRRVLRQGFGFPKCQCGSGTLTFNVHRAASVYTPRTVVIVNPPSPERVRRLSDAGGQARALSWVIGGLTTRRPEEVGLTRDALLRQLTEQGIAAPVAQAMVEQAAASDQLADDAPADLSDESMEQAAASAVTIALALSESRVRVADLAGATDEWSTLGIKYRDSYPAALEQARLEAVELIDSFPVLTGNFGYTRGASTPGASRLVPFRERNGTYVVYGEVGQTEALFFRLNPSAVAQFLTARGFELSNFADDRDARISILQRARVPSPGEDPAATLGSTLLTLIHTYAHRVIRRIAVFAGVERTALSELLVPLHLGFFVYAAARGDFVLGGLQAVFETELDLLLRDVVSSDHRCPLDPGCSRAGAACVACVHVGEPSCRYFNRFLDRRALGGPQGFLRGSVVTPT